MVVYHNCKVVMYPCGVVDVLLSTMPIFPDVVYKKRRASDDVDPLDCVVQTCQTYKSFDRSVRRAKSRVRQLALANNFDYFVTLTLDPKKIDRYDPVVIVKKLSQWCNNMVKRYDLTYILVPERHKDGALHFHGFFKGNFRVVESGHYDSNGHVIYNLPQWTFGYTTAVKLYGDYPKAVSYICKYIGKQGAKPAGRWYYSGGSLSEPTVFVGDVPTDYQFPISGYVADINGIFDLLIVNQVDINDMGGVLCDISDLSLVSVV